MNKRSNWLIVSLLLTGLVLLVACGGQQTGEEQTLFVGPNLVECTGVAPQMCMQVKDTPDGEYRLFYDQIEGFTFEEGYEYELRVRVEPVENAPADASSLKYTLVEEVSKTPVSAATSQPAAEGDVKTLYVGPELVDCVGVGPQQCMQVKENPGDEYTLFYQQIDGFTFEPGYEYELLVRVTTVENPPADGSSLQYTLVDVVSQTPVTAGATAVETDQAASLVGPLWQAQTIQGTAVLPDTEVTAVFGEDGSLGGSAGCNNYFTSYQVDGQTLTIDAQIGSTMMACPDPIMQQEALFLSVLPTTTSYQMNGATLELLDAGGASVATFAVVMPTSLTGTTWQLTSFNNGLGGVTSVIEGTEITAVFGEDGTLSGNAGCNNYNTGFTTDGSNITINAAIASTMMACEDAIMMQETAYLAALPNAATFTIQGDTLELRHATGSLIASYTAVSSEAASLVGPTWQLTTLNNGAGAVASVMAGTEITAMFGEDGSLSGSAGCNNYVTSFTLDGQNIAINGAIAVTSMACADQGVMDQEAAYLAVLPNAATYTVEGDTLELRDATGALLAGYTAVSSAAAPATTLVGPEWRVNTFNNGNQAAVGLLAGTEITMMFGEDGKVQGSAGCNRYFGGYTLNGDALTVGALATTRAFCPEPEGIMEQETQFLMALQSAATFTIQNGSLDIRTADGAIAVLAGSGNDAASGPTMVEPIAGGDTAVNEDRVAALASATYKVSVVPSGSVTLANGQYSEPAAPGSASSISVTLTDNIALGQVDGQPAAAAVLVSSGGGTGNFYQLALVTFADGQPQNIASAFLGDRVQVNSVSFTGDNVISVDMVIQGPDDPMCCPTMPVVNTYELQNGELVQTSSTPKA